MKTRFFTLFVLMMGLAGNVRAQTIDLGGSDNRFSVKVNTYQNFEFTNVLNQLVWYNVSTPIGNFSEISVPDYGFSNIPGYPKVPVLKKLIELPLGAKAEVKVLSAQYKEIDLASYGIMHQLIPAQPPVSKQDDPLTVPFVKNDEVYARNEYLYEEMVRIEPAGILRGVNIANFEFYPVQYNPVNNRLRVLVAADIRITFNGGDVAATLELKKRTASPYFEGTYHQLGNYKQLPTDELITSVPVTYVIISDPMFQAALQPFIQWKIKRGYNVIAKYTNDPQVGNTAASIKAYLASLYNNPPSGYNPQSFVLLVGDVAQIPAFNGTAGSHVTDLPFVEYTGDNLPEAYIGRFSANNLNELQPQINKTLEYEQYLFPNESFLGEAVMVAGEDASHMTWSNGQINYGTTYYFNLQHGILSHTYLQPEPTGGNYSQNIIQNVSNGVGYANYTAHCSPSGWANPSFTISNIPSLQNQSKYPLMVGNCCQSSQFNTTCFAEELLRANNKGAVGYIGGTNNTYWDEDFYWGVGFKNIVTNPPYDPNHLGAYDVTFHDHGEPSSSWYVTQGQMVVGGNMAVQQSNSTMKTYYWEIYCLMGDPSLMIYYGIPQPVAASYDPTLLMGMTNLTVNTEENAYVALSYEGNLVAAAMAGPTGSVNLNFNAFSSPGTAQLVIIKQNRKPHLGNIQIIPATGPYLVVQSVTVNDSLGNNNFSADYEEDVFLNITLKNVGVQPAQNINMLLASSDTNISLTDTTHFVQSVNPNATVLVRNAFRLTVHPVVPNGYNVPLNFSLTSDTLDWLSTKNLKIFAPVLSAGNIVIDDATTGNGNGILDPGETAYLIIPTTNSGGAVAINSVGQLTFPQAASQYIMATNPTVNLDNIGIGATKNAVFNVISNIITPVNTPITFIYTVSTGSQGQITAPFNKQLVIGATPNVLMANGSMSACNARFYDSGGPDNDYGLNENYVMTFYPGFPGAKVKISFNSFNVEPNSTCSWDYLQIYNGTTVNTSTLVGTYCGTSIPPAFTANNSEGAITIRFKSDGVVTKPGWDANISCVGGNLYTIAAAFPPEICMGGSTQLGTLTQGGTGNYTYVWHPGKYLNDSTSPTPIATPPVTTEFTVEVFDGQSTVTATALVVVHPLPETPVIEQQGSMLVSSVAEGNQWFNEIGPIPGATQQTFTPTISGTYYTIVTSEFGCASQPSNSIYVLVTGIAKEEQPAWFVVSPNPFDNYLNIHFTLTKDSPVRIDLLDIVGNVIATPEQKSNLSAGTYRSVINTSTLPAGVYMLRFTTEADSFSRKIVKTNK
ncbi:MAG: C25 family cysteine peptidase [Bacteroidales bacterium]